MKGRSEEIGNSLFTVCLHGYALASRFIGTCISLDLASRLIAIDLQLLNTCSVV